MESLAHILFGCDHAKSAWELTLQIPDTDQLENTEVYLTWIHILETQGAKELFKNIVLAWLLWKAQNLCIFKAPVNLLLLSFSHWKNLTEEISLHYSQQSTKPQPTHTESWAVTTTGIPGMYFIFIDAACKNTMGSIAGILISAGRLQLRWGKKLTGAYSPEEAEAAALLEAFLKVQHNISSRMLLSTKTPAQFANPTTTEVLQHPGVVFCIAAITWELLLMWMCKKFLRKRTKTLIV